MVLKFREGTKRDIDQLKALGLAAYGPFMDVLTEENGKKLHAALTAETLYTDLLSKSKCFLCEADANVIGMAYLIPKGNPTDIFQEDWSYIRMVGVHPDYNGKGIGRKLAQQCIDHAKQTGERVVALHTSEFMDAARHLYESLGFKQIREIDPRFGKKYWLYQLEV